MAKVFTFREHHLAALPVITLNTWDTVIYFSGKLYPVFLFSLIKKYTDQDSSSMFNANYGFSIGRGGISNVAARLP